jgi:hypothetical protein
MSQKLRVSRRKAFTNSHINTCEYGATPARTEVPQNLTIANKIREAVRIIGDCLNGPVAVIFWVFRVGVGEC